MRPSKGFGGRPGDNFPAPEVVGERKVIPAARSRNWPPFAAAVHSPARFQAFSPFFFFLRLRRSISCLLLGTLLGVLILPGQLSGAEEEEPRPFSELTKPEQAVRLWDEAEAMAEVEPGEAAARYLVFFRTFPEDSRAEEALWLAATLRKRQMAAADRPDWGMVRDLYRTFITEYPQSASFQEAYLELGVAHYRMHFFREALSYFKLYLDRFPDSLLAPWARYWQGRTLTEIGRYDEAQEIYQKLATGADQELRVKTILTLGDLYFRRDRYEAALHAYRSVEKELAPYEPLRWEVIRRQGEALARKGEEKKGRDLLYRYLNVVEDSTHRSRVLFELAESYHRQKLHKAARHLYAQVLELESPAERVAVLSRFRQAQDRESRELAGAEWQKPDWRTIAGDRPYLAVLNIFYEEPVAQEARYGLLRRYLAREEFELAYPVAKAYLERGEKEDERVPAVRNILGRILVARLEALLQEEKYQEVYDLYRRESPWITDYPQGRLLILVGRALEALELYQQASVIYYRALQRFLTEEEKIDLYYRRADVYLSQNDLAAAERLLTYLREIYAGSEPMGEISYLSGRLREAQSKPGEALPFYVEAARILTFPGKKSIYAQAHLRVLFELGKYEEAAAALADYSQEAWLTPPQMQASYQQLGSALKGQKRLAAAAGAYEAGLADHLPQENETAQVIHLDLGEVYFRMGDTDKSRAHYQAARGGANPLLRKIAEERLNQVEIETTLQQLS